MTQYYDMKLVIFSVNDQHSLVTTIPVFIIAFNRESLVLYETGTVKVPINDLNETVNSYSTVIISKPYMSIIDEYYILLHIQELCMCKHNTVSSSVRSYL